MNELLIRNITHIFVVQNSLIKCKKKNSEMNISWKIIFNFNLITIKSFNYYIKFILLVFIILNNREDIKMILGYFNIYSFLMIIYWTFF